MSMAEMHNELSKTGRAGCLTGLIWLLRRLGFVSGPGEQDDSGQSSTAAGSQPGQGTPAGMRAIKRRKSSAPSPGPVERPSTEPSPGRARPRSSAHGSVGDVVAAVSKGMKEGEGVQCELRLGKLQGAYMVVCGQDAMQSCRRIVGRRVGCGTQPASARGKLGSRSRQRW